MKWLSKNSTLIVSILVITITLIAAFLRFNQIGKLSFWNDEIDTAIFATYSFKDMLKSDPNMSLYYSIAHFWVRIFPHASEAVLRTLSAIFSIASIPVVFLLGKNTTDDKKKGLIIGLIASLLISLNAFHIQYAQEFRSYSLVFLLTSLSTLLFIKTIEDPNSKYYWGVWYTVVTAAAFYSHFYAIFILGAHAVALFVIFLEKKKDFSFGGVIRSGIAMALLIYPIVAIAHAKGGGQISWIQSPNVNNVIRFIKEISNISLDWPLTIYLSVAVIGFLGLLKAKWKAILILSSLILPIVFSISVSKLLTPIFIDKYLLFVMPYMAILAATGAVTIATFKWHNWKLRLLTLPIGFAFLAMIVWQGNINIKNYFDQTKKEDWKGASQFLVDNCSDSLRVYYVTYMEKNVLYYKHDLWSKDLAWWAATLKQKPNAEQLAASLPSNYNQVCLVLGHIGGQNIDQKNIIQTALKTKFPKVQTVSKYYGVKIEIYKH